MLISDERKRVEFQNNLSKLLNIYKLYIMKVARNRNSLLMMDDNYKLEDIIKLSFL